MVWWKSIKEIELVACENIQENAWSLNSHDHLKRLFLASNALGSEATSICPPGSRCLGNTVSSRPLLVATPIIFRILRLARFWLAHLSFTLPDGWTCGAVERVFELVALTLSARYCAELVVWREPVTQRWEPEMGECQKRAAGAGGAQSGTD